MATLARTARSGLANGLRVPTLRARSLHATRTSTSTSLPSAARAQHIRPLARYLNTDSSKPGPSTTPASSLFAPLDVFVPRHIGPRVSEQQQMLDTLGFSSIEEFVNSVVPPSIRTKEDVLDSIEPLSESELLRRANEIAGKNKVLKNFIGMGYHNAVVPPVILRNILENPLWYTSYTPYQPEIAQGRLESLLNFQTAVTSLTGLTIANASLLDEGTAAAEAMALAYNQKKSKRTFLVDFGVLPQTLAVLKARAAPFGIKVRQANVKRVYADEASEANKQLQEDIFGVLVQYPKLNGELGSWESLAKKAHDGGALVVAATDLLALTMLRPPGEWGADIAVGNSARFGVPLGYGGPHAAFFACSDALKRKIPGRLIGVSRDAEGKVAYRLALQTREQHIRRDKATSNICTAQALLANMAAMYCVWHGPGGIRNIAEKVHGLTRVVKAAIDQSSHEVLNSTFFDTLTIGLNGVASRVFLDEAVRQGVNVRTVDEYTVGVTFDEATTVEDVVALLNVFTSVPSGRRKPTVYTKTSVLELAEQLGIKSPLFGAGSDAEHSSDKNPSTISRNYTSPHIPEEAMRTTPFLTHEVFNTHRSETDMLRYMALLQGKDLSLAHAMIPLGSCTMKLNPTASMMPLTQKGLAELHPFVPKEQAAGYAEMMDELTEDLSLVTGFPAISLQPNSGAQGEYAGLSVIRAYHHARGDSHRDICLIPGSAHGTNPASAIMAGMKVVAVKTLASGALDIEDLRSKAEQHKANLAAFMVTYPSTYGVFESGVQEACKIIHDNGGQVYMDGANLNAQMGLTNPAVCGADVCHLNLHKTFSIPHGGGGPGMGPIGVAEHLAPYLPGHPLVKTGGKAGIQPISAAPFGSASILSISWAYIKLSGGAGLKKAAIGALLSANYMAHRLQDHYKIRFVNENGRCAHEFIIDVGEFESSAGLKVMDFAKRLQDYGFHPPTCSWPVPTAMLIEPTESESLHEIDRFIDALISIRQEVRDIESGSQPRGNNLLVNAPHPVDVVLRDSWEKPYSREQAAYPDGRLRKSKFWPTTSRIDDAYGDRNLVCECPSVEEVAEQL